MLAVSLHNLLIADISPEQTQHPYILYKSWALRWHPHLEGVDVAEELAKLLNFFKEFMVLTGANSPLIQLAT